MKVLHSLLGAGLIAVLATAAAGAVPTNELREALRLTPDYEHGRMLFETCAACHGPQGGGVADGGIPSIAGQHYEFIIKQLADFRDAERWDPRMTAFSSQHHLAGPQDLADVAAYIESLPRRASSDHGSGEFLSLGARLYSRSCSNCHGAAGEGNDRLRYPRTGGQHYRYLLLQMRVMAAGQRSNIAWDHMKLLQSLSREVLAGVADYLSRLDSMEQPTSGASPAPGSASATKDRR